MAKYKIGDVLECILSFNHNSGMVFFKGKEYKIIDIGFSTGFNSDTYMFDGDCYDQIYYTEDFVDKHFKDSTSSAYDRAMGIV